MACQRNGALLVLAAFLATCLCSAATLARPPAAEPLSGPLLGSECGDWIVKCAHLESNGTALRGEYNFTGIFKGTYRIQRDTFSPESKLCEEDELIVMAAGYEGDWIDLGAAATGFPNNTRQVALLSMTFTVTPFSADQATYLNSACPCNGNWTANVTRTFTSCPTATCPDTSFLGGSTAPGKAGILPGLPAFGLAYLYHIAGKDHLRLSQLDADPATGFTNNFTNSDLLFVLTEPCGPEVEVEDHYCAEWAQPCVPSTYDGGEIYAFQTNFSFQGAFDGEDPAIYHLSNTSYVDLECTSPFIAVREVGTILPHAGTYSPEGFVNTQKYAGIIYVTPYTQEAMVYLQDNCACGDPSLWVVGQERTLTSCPNTTCTTDGWYTGDALGSIGYGNIIELERLPAQGGMPVRELQMTAFSSTPAGYLNAPTSGDASFGLADAVCAYPDPNHEICGEWDLLCSAGNTNTRGDEMALTYQFDGTGEQGDGTFRRFRAFYTPNQGCKLAAMTLLIEDTGFWAQVGDPTPDGTHLILNVPSTKVTPVTQDWADWLNRNCPCGIPGAWAPNAARVLTTCAPAQCSDTAWLGGGTLGQPGYGLFSRLNSTIRVSSIMDNQTAGFAQQMPLTSLPLDMSGSCPKEEYSNQVCGEWYQPCRAENDDTLDFVSDAIFDNSTKTYSLVRTNYAPATGCAGAIYIFAEQHGKYEINGASTAVPHGQNLKLLPDAIAITPYDGTAQLQSDCPCGGNWTSGVTRTFTAPCPNGTCTTFSWLRGQPLGIPAYGGILRSNSSLRITRLSDNAADGYSQSLTTNDFSFVLKNSSYCTVPAPPPPPPPPPPTTTTPTPTPAPTQAPTKPSKSSSSKKISAGSVLLIIFFCGGFVYFVGGAIVMYSRTGAVAVPNQEFWSSLPGLAMEGVLFVFSCGARGSTPRYARANFDEAGGSSGGYGTL